jgi:hypothetical protein
MSRTDYARHLFNRLMRWPRLPLALALGDAIVWTVLGVIWWKALP